MANLKKVELATTRKTYDVGWEVEMTEKDPNYEERDQWSTLDSICIEEYEDGGGKSIVLQKYVDLSITGSIPDLSNCKFTMRVDRLKDLKAVLDKLGL